MHKKDSMSARHSAKSERLKLTLETVYFFSSLLKDGMEHRPGQFSRKRVLLAGVIGT